MDQTDFNAGDAAPAAFAARRPSYWENKGLIAGEYRVIESLGFGSFGQVYRLQHTLNGTEYAAKRSRHPVEGYQHLLRELRAWIGLPSHPFVQPFGFCRLIDQELVLFSPFMAGGSVRGYLSAGSLNAPTLLSVAAEAAAGLGVIHQAGWVHLDIKPDNILLTQDHRAKLADFGIARAVGATTVRGSKRYQSPEQAGGGECSPASDVFSWAATTLELVLGEATWEVGSEANDALWLALAQGRIAAHVAEVLAPCLEADPRLRPTIQDVNNAVATWLRTVPPAQQRRELPGLDLISPPPGHDGSGIATALEEARSWQEQFCPEAQQVIAAEPSSTRVQVVEALLLYDMVEAKLRARPPSAPVIARFHSDRARAHQSLGDGPGALDVLMGGLRLMEPFIKGSHTEKLAQEYARLQMQRAGILSMIGNREDALSAAREALHALSDHLFLDPWTRAVCEDPQRASTVIRAGFSAEKSEYFDNIGSALVPDYLAAFRLTVSLLGELHKPEAQAAARTMMLQALPLTLLHGYFDMTFMLLQCNTVCVETLSAIGAVQDGDLEVLEKNIAQCDTFRDLSENLLRSTRSSMDALTARALVTLTNALTPNNSHKFPQTFNRALVWMTDAADRDATHFGALASFWTDRAIRLTAVLGRPSTPAGFDRHVATNWNAAQANAHQIADADADAAEVYVSHGEIGQQVVGCFGEGGGDAELAAQACARIRAVVFDRARAEFVHRLAEAVYYLHWIRIRSAPREGRQAIQFEGRSALAQLGIIAGEPAWQSAQWEWDCPGRVP